MKVWLDILTPKQVNFLGELHHRLIGRGFKTLITTREYREVNEFLDLKGLKAIQVGRHGGGELDAKLLESSKRTSALATLIKDEKPDVAISFSSPEAARVAFGLKIPHYCVSDSPHAEAVCRLTIPLSKKLFAPWVIPAHAWTRYGILPRDVVSYRAIDPLVWLTDQTDNLGALSHLKLDLTKPIVVIRTPEELAAYLTDRSSTLPAKLTDIIRKILELCEGAFQTLVMPRYDGQRERLRKIFGDALIMPDRVIDAIPLLRRSSVFVGGGGTMTAEAAMLGVPVISYYPGEATFVERFLINYGLVERMLDPGRVAQRVIAISRSEDFREFYQKKSAKLLRSMEDPMRVIIQRIFKR